MTNYGSNHIVRVLFEVGHYILDRCTHFLSCNANLSLTLIEPASRTVGDVRNLILRRFSPGPFLSDSRSHSFNLIIRRIKFGPQSLCYAGYMRNLRP